MVIIISIIKVIELHQSCLVWDLVASGACEFLRDTLYLIHVFIATALAG